VYPNPASNYIIVYNYLAGQNRNVELIDISGRVVKRQIAVNLANRMEINGLANGLYILKVRDNKGKAIRTEKIIIQR
jgi:hypothetical protein